MRLLDHIAQSRVPLLVRRAGALWRLPSACDFAADISRCPLRYVLTDELLRLCVELAYSEGDKLAGCLDLVRFPAEQLWIEWSDPVKSTEITRLVPQYTRQADSPNLRSGVLIAARPGSARAFRACRLHTFWMSRADPANPVVAAVETHIDLDRGVTCQPVEAFLDGGMVAVREPEDACVDAVLQYAGFRLHPAWQRYCGSAVRGPERAGVISACLGGVTFDVPIILALLLLLELKAGLRQLPVQRARLNAKRMHLHKPPLLEHIEVACPVLPMAGSPAGAHTADTPVREAPRFHHVRGHLVRRADAVFWRRPHWRGHLRLGCVRSRTVELRPPAFTPAETAAGGPGTAG